MNPAPILPVDADNHVELMRDPVHSGSVLVLARRLVGFRWHARIYRRDWSPKDDRQRRFADRLGLRFNPRRCTGGMICYGVPF